MSVNLRILPGLAMSGLMLIATGCATVPSPLAGDFPDFQPSQATERSVGANVRWGGHIVNTRPQRDQTCIEILARELDRDMRPVSGDHNHGRFLACRDGFQDPAVFTNGRQITVIGQIEGFTQGRIGEFDYRYPRLDAQTLYLWAERPDVVVYQDPWWPYWDPWWPYRHPYHFRGPRSHISGTVIIR